MILANIKFKNKTMQISSNSLANLNIKPQRVKIGEVYGRMTVLSKNDTPHRQSRFYCQCSCGNIKSVFAFCLLNGNTKSCGCLAVEVNTKHGDEGSSEYRVWVAMKQRCINPKSQRYRNYGGRGITVCDRWLSYSNFISDIGKRPSEQHSIERRDNDGNYQKDNCYWATDEVQRNNKQNTRYYEYEGVVKSQSQWARYFKIKDPTRISRMIRNGRTFEQVYIFYEIKNIKKQVKTAYNFQKQF